MAPAAGYVGGARHASMSYLSSAFAMLYISVALINGNHGKNERKETLVMVFYRRVEKPRQARPYRVMNMALCVTKVAKSKP